jgi:hypothetical protein
LPVDGKIYTSVITKIKLPDSIVCASAITLKAILLSNDSALLKTDWPGLIVRKV